VPHVIELFVADHCPGSPDALARVREFAEGRSDVVVIEHQIEDDLDTARGYGLCATPAIVIDRMVLMYGVPTIAQLASRCEKSIATVV
jgi:hypothetical protein